MVNDGSPRADLRKLVDRGTRLSRLRVLQVVCDHQRELAAVYRLDGRDVLVFGLTTSGAIGSTEDLRDPERTWRRFADGTAVDFIDTHGDDDVAEVSIRCCSRSMNMRWLRREIHATAPARRRVVLRSGDGKL